MFGGINLDDILAGFTKTIDKLDKFAVAKKTEADELSAKAKEIMSDAVTANDEKTRATNIKNKLLTLIDGEK